MIEGAVRSHKLLSDGRRQIGAFHLPGDIFGLENGDFHRFTAEAIVDTTVRLVKRQSLERVAKNRSCNGSEPPDHDDRQSSSMSRTTCFFWDATPRRERVAAFLLEMNGRLTAAGVIALPMSRRDIADYLGLTLETVSRVLSEFQRKGYLRFLDQMQRQIVVLNVAGLAELDRSHGAHR